MRRAAKTLTAGTLLGTATCLLFAGAATSQQQSQVLNDQVQLGDVFASQTLNVVDAAGPVQAATPATGNSLIASAVASPVDVQSNQRVNADIYAETTVTASGYAGDSAAFSTAATGNTAESNVEDTGLSGSSVQTVGPGTVQAFTLFDGPNASAGGLSISTQAVVNSQGLGVVSSTADYTVNQDSEANAQADTGATLRYTGGTVVSSAIATVNNVTATGTVFSNQTLDVTQRSTGATAEATSYTYAGNAQDITAQATVTANNISATNEGGDFSVIADQTNASDVNAEAYLSSFQFGAATASAYGVGNSTLAGNFGPTVTLDNSQVNTGGVSVFATFVGDNGYDAYTSATAIGNAVTGYACTDCPPTRMTITNNQVNSGPVSATGSMTITGPNRQANAVTSATGNTATFYVNSPQ